MSSTPDPYAEAIAGSATRLSLMARHRLAQRAADRLAAATRHLGADRRHSPRRPMHATGKLEHDGHTHTTLTRDASLGGFMLARPPGLAAEPGARVAFRLDGIGALHAEIVAASPHDLSLKLGDRQAVNAAEALNALLGRLDRRWSALIRLAGRFAAEASLGLADEIARGASDIATLFSADLERIESGDPAQYRHPAADSLTRALSPLLARHWRPELGVVYAVATDRNGYSPLHNPPFVQAPRPHDLLFNHHHVRDRRIDRSTATLAATRFAQDSLLQRRDWGGATGDVVEAAAPILVAGRRWGAARIGVALDADPVALSSAAECAAPSRA